MPPGDQASPNELGATFAAHSCLMRGASSRVPRLKRVPSSRMRSGCGFSGAKKASHQFCVAFGGDAVVPGVSAAAGKAGSSQSSLAKAVSSRLRIFFVTTGRLQLVTSSTVRELVFLRGTDVSLRLFRSDTASCVVHPSRDRPMGGLYACYASCVRQIHGFLRFLVAGAATAFQQLDHRRRRPGARRRRDERSQILVVDATQRCASNPSASRVCWCRRQTEQLRGAGLSLAGLSR